MKQEKITIKNSWKELSISEYVQIQDISLKQYDDDVDYALDILSILSDKDRSFLGSIPAPHIINIARSLNFLNTKMEKGTLQAKYTINGKNYNAILNVNDFSAIQYIDLSTLLKDNEGNKNLHYILAVILIPEGKEYNTYDIHEVANEIKNHFRFIDAYALSLFFSTLTKSLMQATQMLSARKILKMEKSEKDPERKKRLKNLRKELKLLARNGAGITTWILLQKKQIIHGWQWRI